MTSSTPGVSITAATINVPNNIPGSGIPIVLSSGLGVTSGSFTLQYNPSLLAISGAVTKIPGATFTVILTPISPTLATAVLSFSSPAPISTSATPITIGNLLATVPLSATATYGAKALLHFSSDTLNGTAGAIAITNQDGVEVAAYFGDVDETGGPLALNDATVIAATASGVPNTAAQTIPGFAAYPNIDPIIIGDVSLQGIVNSTDAGAMLQEVGGIARITIPYAPIGLAVTPAGPSALASPAAASLGVHAAPHVFVAWEQIGTIAPGVSVQAPPAIPALTSTAPGVSLPSLQSGTQMDLLADSQLVTLGQPQDADLVWNDDEGQAPLGAKWRGNGIL